MKEELREIRLKVWLERNIFTKNGIIRKQRFEKNVRKLYFKYNFYNI